MLNWQLPGFSVELVVSSATTGSWKVRTPGSDPPRITGEPPIQKKKKNHLACFIELV